MTVIRTCQNYLLGINYANARHADVTGVTELKARLLMRRFRTCVFCLCGFFNFQDLFTGTRTGEGRRGKKHCKSPLKEGVTVCVSDADAAYKKNT